MASAVDIKNVQKIHSLTQTGTYNTATTNAIKNYQRQWGFQQSGVLDNNTLQKYKTTWPYAWGLNTGGVETSGTVSPYPSTSASGAYDLPASASGALGLVINGVILFGIFKVLMKVF
jgi:hypothetical protein